MYLKISLVLSCVVLGSCAKADVVVLQNLNTTGQATVVGSSLDTNIRFSTTATSSSLSRLILFGTALQTGITANFNLSGSAVSTGISATEIASGQYAFNLVGVAGLSSMIAGDKILSLRSFSSGAAFFTTTNATMTSLNGAGFVGGSYDGNTLQYQFEGNSTAIPEPITLILTTSALAAGGVGAWIKRRRQKAAEVVEDHKLR